MTWGWLNCPNPVVIKFFVWRLVGIRNIPKKTEEMRDFEVVAVFQSHFDVNIEAFVFHLS